MRSSYYYGKQIKPINDETIRLKVVMHQIFNDSNGSAGTRTIVAILWHQHSIKLKKSMGLISRQLKQHKYKHCDQVHKVYNNTWTRNFKPTAPNQIWTGDVTYIHIKNSPNSLLTGTALQMAYHTSLNPAGVMFHSN